MTLQYRSDADLDTHRIDLDDDQRSRQQQLLDGVVVSLHDHPVRLPEPLTHDNWTAHSALHEDMLAAEELDRSALDIVFASSLSEPSLDHVLHWARALDVTINNPNPALRRSFVSVQDTGDLGGVTPQLAIVKSLEDLVLIGDDVNLLETLFAVGIRSAGISYNFGSALGGGLAEPEDHGLTSVGRAAVRAMNELGMIVDISHAGDRTGLDTVAASTRPIMISHAGARAMWAADRMKPDDVIRAVAEAGGLIGIEAAPGSTRTRRDSSQHDINDFVAHLEYCVELVGVEHVALGPDTFYGDHVGLYQAAGWSARPIQAVPEIDIQHVAGADNPSEVPRQVASILIKRGWSDSDIAQILGQNALRVMKEALPPCQASN